MVKSRSVQDRKCKLICQFDPWFLLSSATVKTNIHHSEIPHHFTGAALVSESVYYESAIFNQRFVKSWSLIDSSKRRTKSAEFLNL